MINTTLTNSTNLEAKLPSKLEVMLKRNKIPIEDKPSNKDVYLTLLTTMDNEAQAFYMGEKLGLKFDSRTTTPIHSYFNTQPKANETPTTYAANETMHISKQSQ